MRGDVVVSALIAVLAAFVTFAAHAALPGNVFGRRGRVRRDLELSALMPQRSAARRRLLASVDQRVELMLDVEEGMVRDRIGIFVSGVTFVVGSAMTFLGLAFRFEPALGLGGAFLGGSVSVFLTSLIRRPRGDDGLPKSMTRREWLRYIVHGKP